MRLEVHPENPQARIVKQAAEILEDDGLVLYPTESGYAIGCNAESSKAIHKLYALKKPMKKFFMALIVPRARSVHVHPPRRPAHCAQARREAPGNRHSHPDAPVFQGTLPAL